MITFCIPHDYNIIDIPGGISKFFSFILIQIIQVKSKIKTAFETFFNY